MQGIQFPLFALSHWLLIAVVSLCKAEICRQHSALANGLWQSGDRFAFCALKNGHATLKDFSDNYSLNFALIGHQDNAHSLRTTFSSWINKGVCQQSWKQKSFLQPCFNSRSPLFLHLSGPSGVGKTMFSEYLSGMLFKERRKDENDPQRELHHCGHSIHQLSTLERENDLVHILDTIYGQLHFCPFSVFTLENFHLANKQLLVNLLSHLKDGSVPNSEGDHSERESIRSAIFIFTSNLGGYNASQSAAGARIDVRTAVRQHFEKEFRSVDPKLVRLRGMLESVFLDNVETFLPLRPQELAEVAQLELTKIQQELYRHSAFQQWKGRLRCDKNCSNHLADACLHNRYDCATRMVYGLKHFLTDELYLRMFELKSFFSEDAFNNSDMHVLIILDELHLKLVGIPANHKPGTAGSSSNTDL
jgi:hypothetical protein